MLLPALALASGLIYPLAQSVIKSIGVFLNWRVLCFSLLFVIVPILLQVKVPDPMVMAQLKKEQEEVEKLHDQIAELQRENTEKSSHISELNGELSKLRDKISQLEAALKAGTVAAVASNTDTEVNPFVNV